VFWDGKLEDVVWCGSSMMHEFLLCLWCSVEQRARNGGVQKQMHGAVGCLEAECSGACSCRVPWLGTPTV
jgi:hypothetical protein